MSKKLTKEEFEEKAKKVHGDKYGYDKVVYEGNKIKVEIYCKKCKKYFWQAPSGHINLKQGCRICGYKTLGSESISHEEFIIRFQKNNPSGFDNIIILGKYAGCDKEIECQCKKCNKIIFPKASSLTRKNRGYNLHRCSTRKILDLVGKQFGKWTVIGPVASYKKTGEKTRWVCECSCGCNSKKEVLQDSLLRGASQSCGKNKSGNTILTLELVLQCLNYNYSGIGQYCKKYPGHYKFLKKNHPDILDNRFKDRKKYNLEVPIGSRFGKFTTLEEPIRAVDKHGNNIRLVKCLCDCGVKKIVALHYLRYRLKCGSIPSCGKCIKNNIKELIEFIFKKHGYIGLQSENIINNINYLLIGSKFSNLSINGYSVVSAIRHIGILNRSLDYYRGLSIILGIQKQKIENNMFCKNNKRGFNHKFLYLFFREIFKKSDIEVKHDFPIKINNTSNILYIDIAFIKKDNILFAIEVDGEQHFKPNKIFHGDDFYKFIDSTNRDKKKNKFFNNKKIPLIRVKDVDLWDYDYRKSFVLDCYQKISGNGNISIYKNLFKKVEKLLSTSNDSILIDKIKEMSLTGVSRIEIAKTLGVTKRKITRIRSRMSDREKKIIAKHSNTLKEKRCKLQYSKPIYCEQTLEEFHSISEAARVLGVSGGSIVCNLKERLGSVHGYSFKYKTKKIKLINIKPKHSIKDSHLRPCLVYSYSKNKYKVFKSLTAGEHYYKLPKTCLSEISLSGKTRHGFSAKRISWEEYEKYKKKEIPSKKL